MARWSDCILWGDDWLHWWGERRQCCLFWGCCLFWVIFCTKRLTEAVLAAETFPLLSSTSLACSSSSWTSVFLIASLHAWAMTVFPGRWPIFHLKDTSSLKLVRRVFFLHVVFCYSCSTSCISECITLLLYVWLSFKSPLLIRAILCKILPTRSLGKRKPTLSSTKILLLTYPLTSHLKNPLSNNLSSQDCSLPEQFFLIYE